MFQVYHSNSLLVLKDLVIELIRREPLDDPFVAEQILVQSPGMAQWLKLELAAAQGIAASVDFPLPASFLWRCFSTVLEQVPERSAFNKEAMSWKLMQVLPALLERDEFSALRQYLQDDRDDYRLYQLSGKIADIFDQYLVYRPDWIADWEQGGDLASRRHPWQPILWRELSSYTQQRGQSHWHRANMFSAFCDALAKPQPPAQLPTRLFVFGISALPQNFIEALQALGQRIDVHLMVTNPCRYYWGDIVDEKHIARMNRQWFGKTDLDYADYAEGNPLLASMGKLGRDYLFQLQETGSEEITAFADPERQSLLASVQQDILDLENPARYPEHTDSSEHKQPLAASDNSIVLHSCHSPLREIEVLHDQLLQMFADNPDLKPRDLIVMMPDVATYAPYIEAVFSNAPAERYIPYSISDRSGTQESPLLLSFEKLLKLNDSRFTVSDLLELLEVPAIMRRFNLDESGFQKLRVWIDDVNIRWGLDAEHRSLWQIPIFEQNSWQFGLRRMLCGYALGEQEQLWQGITPYAEIEGLKAELLGTLADFIDLLEATQQAFTQPRMLGEWLDCVNHILERFYLPDEQDEIAINSVRKTLLSLHEQLSDAGFEAPLSPAVLADYLTKEINASNSAQRFMVGAVNLCTLMPMRSIPFRVVCLLGMNDGSYPRTIPPLGFDLMNDYPRKGDRSRRDDDRYLFMEALLSAQEKLYISYVGRSIKDNSEKVPSVLVSELLDYIQAGYALAEDQLLPHEKSAEKLLAKLLLQHPLTAFSPAYFNQNDERLFSFASEWLAVLQDEQKAAAPFYRRPLPEEIPEQLELTDLLAFLRQPCRFFIQKRLGVSFYSSEISAADEEPFALDGLDAYLIKQRYLEAALAEQDLDQLDRKVEAEGLMPVGQIGRLTLAKYRHDCTELAEKIRPFQQGNAQRLEVDLLLSDIRLVGWLDNCYEAHQLSFRPAEVSARDRLNSWVKHLCLCASGYACNTSVYRGLSGKVFFPALTPSEAAGHLQNLLSLYVQGMSQPLAFDPATAHDYCVQLAKEPEKARSKVEARFYGGPFNNGLQDDLYFRRCFSSFEHFYSEFEVQAAMIYQPLLAYAQEGGDD